MVFDQLTLGRLDKAVGTQPKIAQPRISSVFGRGEDILRFEVGVVGQQITDARVGVQLAKYRADGDPRIADAGQTALPGRACSDAYRV